MENSLNSVLENFKNRRLQKQQSQIQENQNVELKIVSETDFLSELENDKFISNEKIENQQKITKTQQKKLEAEERKREKLLKKQEAEEKRQERLLEKEQKRQMKKEVIKKHFDKEDDTPTELLGKERLELYAKINQYKLLFPNNKQLQKLKIKKGATADELILVLNECEAYVSTDTVDTFITDAILQTIKVGELITVNTRFNITGLSNMLKQNIQFTSLCKQLYLKYKVFSSIPPEHQLALIVVTSAWICVQANKQQTNQINLEQKVDPKDFE